MSTIDWPTSITPAAAQWALQKAGVQFASPFNGTVQAVDYVAERWAVSLSLPNARNHGAVAALMNTLAGGVNRVNLWHHGSGGQPAGTLRGAPVLGSAAARGDAALTLSGCTGANALRSGSFEIDSNGDGVADHWSGYSNATTGTISRWLSSAASVHGTAAQRAMALGLGTSSADQAGIVQSVLVPNYAGQPATLSASVAVYDGTPSVRLHVEWYDASNATLQTDFATFTQAAGSFFRRQLSMTAPVGAVRAGCYVWMHSRQGSPGLAVFDVDAAQLQLGATATDFQGAPTLLAGDMIGCSGHLFQVASDCTATDAGAMTVPIINRVRGTIASGTAVTWYRPTAQFILPAMSAGAMQVPGYTQGPALDLLEVY